MINTAENTGEIRVEKGSSELRGLVNVVWEGDI